jgi:hypothetical protein
MMNKSGASKSMNTTTWVLAAVAAILLVVAFRQDQDLPLAGLMAAGRTLWRSLLLGITFAVPPIAGLLAEGVARVL